MSTNLQPSGTNATARVPPNSLSQPHGKLYEKDFGKAHRPNTAPIMNRSNSGNENKASPVDGRQKVPNTQRSQQRPASSINMRSNGYKERKSNGVALEKQQPFINPNVVSKLRQNRNYQPPRRKTQKYNSSEITPNSKQGMFSDYAFA
jgi:hypothetical protein